MAGAVLIKQSALLVLLPPCTWLLLRSGSRRRRVQAVAALLLALALCLPWLQHNWITTLSGTNRAVIESAAREGDPSVLSLASWLHYPLLLPDQIGVLPLLIGLLGAATGLWRARKQGHLGATSPAVDQGIWLVGTTLSALLFITLSPNKDSRYLAPVLPMLVIGLGWGWWQLHQQLRHRHGRATGLLATGGAMAVCATIAGQQAWSRIDSQEPPPWNR